MGKRYIDSSARCPYYRSEDAQHICCSGPEEGAWCHVAFGDKRTKAMYKSRYCRLHWALCSTAIGLREVERRGKVQKPEDNVAGKDL